MRPSKILLSVCCAVICSADLAAAQIAPAAEAAKTLLNLKAASALESAAAGKYLAFAAQADKEGFTQAASLFRGLARSEQALLKNTNNALLLAAVPAPTPASFAQPKSTPENLRTAFFEASQLSSSYPGYVDTAKLENHVIAIRVFEWAAKVRAQHVKLLTDVLNDSANWKSGKKTYVVCQRCGYVTAQTTIQVCPVSFAARADFSEVE
ncbi:MAG TPA: ferritin family protein [Oligoflexia bacterium]|nr:ferritin family protein [Oligoflexia bacterium]